MASSRTKKTGHRFPPEVAEAARRRAEQHATMVGEFFKATGIDPSVLVHVPGALFLEIGAILQLREWESQGVFAYLGDELPSSAKALAQVRARIKKGPKEFDGPQAAPLSRQVLRTCIERLAWYGPECLGADIALGQVDEDRFAKELADFIWKHRRERSDLLDPK
jgi:hypothetical protein